MLNFIDSFKVFLSQDKVMWRSNIVWYNDCKGGRDIFGVLFGQWLMVDRHFTNRSWLIILILRNGLFLGFKNLGYLIEHVRYEITTVDLFFMLLHFPIWMKCSHPSSSLFFVNWRRCLRWSERLINFLRDDLRWHICDTVRSIINFIHFIEQSAILLLVDLVGGLVSDLDEFTLLVLEELREVHHLPTLL